MHIHTHARTHTHINVKHTLLNTQPRCIYKACSHRIGLSQLSVELSLVTIEDKMRGTHTVENSNVRCILTYWLMERGQRKSTPVFYKSVLRNFKSHLPRFTFITCTNLASL